MAKKKKKVSESLEKLRDDTRHLIESVLEAAGASLSSHTKELIDLVMDSVELPEEPDLEPDGDGKLRLYHFSVGNSSYGHIGLCADVAHYSPKQALAFLLEHLPEEIKYEDSFVAKSGNEPHIAYICAYLNDAAFSERDIDQVEPVEVEE